MFVRGGYVTPGDHLNGAGGGGYYWSSVGGGSYAARSLFFLSGYVFRSDDAYRYFGFFVRCVALGDTAFAGRSKILPYYNIVVFFYFPHLRTLGTRRYATHGDAEVPVAVVRQVDVVRVEVQDVGEGRRVGDRGPIAPVEARVIQVLDVRADVARANKE